MSEIRGDEPSPTNPKAPRHDQAWIDDKRRRRMASVDNLPAEIRPLVHDYGLNVVKAFMDVGVMKARHIRHLVETVLDEFSPTRGSYSQQGVRTHLDDHPETARHKNETPV